jgi:hypothetical protein
VDADAPVGVTTRAEVIAFCCKDGMLPEAEVAAALGALTLRGVDLAGIDIEPWEFSKRRFRLVAQPVIEQPDGRLLVLPWWTGQSARIYMLYLHDGRLPWPDSTMDPQLKAALDRYREGLNRELEDEIARLVQGAGFKTRVRIKKAQGIGIPFLSGEIDVLAAAPNGDTLWVLEAKDPARVYSIAEMQRAVQRFYAPNDGYVAKLLRKLVDVRTDPISVARGLGAAPTHREVRGVMVTRRPVPAAFVPYPPVPFVTISDLMNLLGPAN